MNRTKKWKTIKKLQADLTERSFLEESNATIDLEFLMKKQENQQFT